MYGMTSSGKIFSNGITNWLIDEADFKHSQCKIYIHYKYSPYVSKLVVLSYVDEFVYWYTSEEIWKWFVDTLEKILYVKFWGYARWFISISISQLKNYYISVDQARYATFVIEIYIYNETIKENPRFHNTTLLHDTIFTK